MNMTVPVEGNGVRQGTNWTKDANGRLIADNVAAGGVVPPADTGGEGIPVTAPESQPARYVRPAPKDNLSPIEQFHPSLDPNKVSISWDEKTGRARIAQRPEYIDAPVETQEMDGGELPDLGEQHDTIVDAVTQQPTGELAEVKGQLRQMGELLTSLITAQLGGKSLAEILGQSVPAAPDYSQVDLYEPAQLDRFIQDAVGRAMQPHKKVMEETALANEFNRVQSNYGSEANFATKRQEAIKLMSQNPALSLEAAYGIVTAIERSLSPRAPQNGANQQRRQLTPQQANIKRDQAAKLPSNGGVRGAGGEAPPQNVTGLGQRIAWYLQQASLGG